MKKIYIYITFPIFSFFYFSFAPVYASQSDENNRGNTPVGSGFSSGHSQHPPHDHHEIDHLKYIRTREERKKKQPH